MDYKTLHGGSSQAASSPSIVEPNNSEPAALDVAGALPEGVYEVWREVEDRLMVAGRNAPRSLVRPAMEGLTSGGKRLRPLLLILSAATGKPDREKLLEASTAIEILHTATLIHDDIVDRAESRRGEPTTVAAYGRETAVATGDYLFAEAFYLLAGIGDPRIVRAFAEAARGLAMGELDQYRAAGTAVEVESYLGYISMKTAGLFKAACVAGGTLGGLSLRQIGALASYGQALGIAFQMSDDVMDLIGKPGLMGKGIGTDLAEGTVTLPIIFALREGDADAIRRALAASDPAPEVLAAGIEAVLATGAVAKTEHWAHGEIASAVKGLTLLPDGPERAFLEAVAGEVVGRSA